MSASRRLKPRRESRSSGVRKPARSPFDLWGSAPRPAPRKGRPLGAHPRSDGGGVGASAPTYPRVGGWVCLRLPRGPHPAAPGLRSLLEGSVGARAPAPPADPAPAAQDGSGRATPQRGTGPVVALVAGVAALLPPAAVAVATARDDVTASQPHVWNATCSSVSHHLHPLGHGWGTVHSVVIAHVRWQMNCFEIPVHQYC